MRSYAIEIENTPLTWNYRVNAHESKRKQDTQVRQTKTFEQTRKSLYARTCDGYLECDV